MNKSISVSGDKSNVIISIPFGNWLKATWGDTPAALAKKIDVSQITAARWLAGKGLPRRGSYVKLAGALSISVEELEYRIDKGADAPTGFLSALTELGPDLIHPAEPFDRKLSVANNAAKEAIASLGARILSEKNVNGLLLNDGTTPLFLLQKYIGLWNERGRRYYIKVCTNNMAIVHWLIEQNFDKITVEVAPGRLVARHRAVLSDSTRQWARQNCGENVSVLSCNALHRTLGVTGSESEERDLKAVVIDNAKYLLVIADKAKLRKPFDTIETSGANPVRWNEYWMKEGRDRLWIVTDLDKIVVELLHSICDDEESLKRIRKYTEDVLGLSDGLTANQSGLNKEQIIERTLRAEEITRELVEELSNARHFLEILGDKHFIYVPIETQMDSSIPV